MTVPIAKPPRSKPFILVGGGALAGIVLLLVVANLDRGSDERPGERRIADPDDAIAPAPLSEAERGSGPGSGSGSGAGSGAGVGLANSLDGGPLVQLEQGAWVQVADESGRLAQQYSARSVDPLPNRELDLEAPRAVFYRPDGRVVVLSADRGRARVPKQALETGRLEGNVVIRVFRPSEPGRPVDITRDRPSISINAADATFDNVSGDIRCEGAVALASEFGSFEGVGLSLFLDPTGGAIESLSIDRSTKPIVFVRGADGRTRPAGATARTPESSPTQPPVAPPTAPARQPAAVAATAPPIYHLTLEDDVVVVRTQGVDAAQRTTTLRGDMLTAVFSMEGGTGFDRFAHRGAAQTSVVGVGVGLKVGLGATPRAHAAPSDREETVTIEYAGRLLLRRADPDAPNERLPSPEAARIDLVADDGRSVEIRDSASEATVRALAVAFQTGVDRVDARGSKSAPIELDSPRLRASGEAFWFEQANGRGGFVGPGTVSLAAGGAAFAALAIDPDRLVVSRSDSGAIVASMQRAAGDGKPSVVDLRWTDALDLVFATTSGDIGDLERATFRGGVIARGDAFTVDAASIDARFATAETPTRATGPEADLRLEQLVATGTVEAPVRARNGDATASLTGTSLDLRLSTNAAGDVVPSTLRALGPVEAANPSQRLWASTLDVRFAEAPASRSGDEQTDEVLALAGDVDTVAATGGVQALVLGAASESARGPDESGVGARLGKEPVRAFADALDGNGPERTLTLSGENVLVVRGAILVDRLGQLVLDDIARTGSSEGPGRVRTYASNVLPADVRPLGRPNRDADDAERPRLVAEWADRFRFDERAREGSGSVLLEGGVKVRSTPDRSSTDAVDAATLELVLGAPDEAREETGGVRRIVAKGGALFNSLRWRTEARTDDPRVFRLSGEWIEYDLVENTGFVDGSGTLLAHVPADVRDAPPVAADAARESDATAVDGETTMASSPIPLGAQGTTRFRWNERLDLERRPEAQADPLRSTVVLRGGVEMLHAGLAEGASQMTLSAALLEADLERVVEEGVPPADAGEGALLGGTAKLLAIRANGREGGERVVIQTTDGRIECDGLSYDVATQRAELTALPGRDIVVLQRGATAPVRAGAMTWDLGAGRIRLRDVRGAAGR